MVTRGDLAANVTSFARHLRAANLSPATQRTYLASLNRLATFLESRGMPTDVAAIRRGHLEAFMEDQLANWKPATAANRYPGIRPFFTWLVEEGSVAILGWRAAAGAGAAPSWCAQAPWSRRSGWCSLPHRSTTYRTREKR